MARAFWKGAINFGMVVIPVRMHVATTATEKPSFHLLHKTDLTRLKQMLFCPQENVYVGRSETVKGYEYAKGQYVVLKDSDFEKVPVRTTHTIDVLGFVKAEEIDPIYYHEAHYLEPEEIGARPYSLFREGLVDTKRVGIAKAAFQRQEHLCCIRPSGKVLVLHTLHYPQEVHTAEQLTLPESKARPEEIKMAQSLINEMAIEFTPEDYKDEYRIALEKMIQDKVAGREIVTPAEKKPEEMPDLMAALKQSLEQARKKSESREKAGAKAK